MAEKGTEELDKTIALLEVELEKLRAKRRFIRESDSGCPSCDFATAAGMVTNCVSDDGKAEQLRMEYLRGELTLRDLLEEMDDTVEGCRYVASFVDDNFDGVKDTFFTEWTKQEPEPEPEKEAEKEAEAGEAAAGRTEELGE